jgi:hypothetical protein
MNHNQYAPIRFNNFNIPVEQIRRDVVIQKQAVPKMMDPRKIGEFILFYVVMQLTTISGAALPMDSV